MTRVWITVVLSLITLFGYTKAEYDLHIRLHGYSNPTNTCPACRQSPLLPPGCCDANTKFQGCAGQERCDNAFFYCLKELDAPPDSDPTETTLCGFQNINGLVSHQNSDGEALDFSGDFVLGIPNPFKLPGISPRWTGVQLYVEVTDIDGTDFRSNQIVDTFSININTDSIDVYSTPKWYNGSFGFASLQLSFKVECLISFYTNCDTSCVQTDNCTCIPGFDGLACERNIDECLGTVCPDNSECVDGVNSFSCNCLPGFSKVGDQCIAMSTDSDHMTTTEDHMISTIDQVTTTTDHMTTVTDHMLTTTVEHMTTTDDHLTTTDNHMTTTNNITPTTDHMTTPPTTPPPNCDPGFTGPICDITVEDCLTANCTEHGICTANSTCECLRGFTGQYCETNINDCLNITCSGNRECVDGVGLYTCECLPGYHGQDCELQDDCTNITCSGHGRCELDNETGFKCLCEEGYTGSLCEREADVCNCSDTQLCVQDGRCVCRPQYMGEQCQTLIGCLDVDCNGSGTCVVREDGSHGCDCHTGYTGDFCDKAANSTLPQPDTGVSPVAYLLPIGLFIVLVVLAVMVTVIVLTRLHIIKQQHIYEDVTPGSIPNSPSKISTNLNESYNSTGIPRTPARTPPPPKPERPPQELTSPPLPEKNNSYTRMSTQARHMSSKTRHMSLPSMQRPARYENHSAIRAHRTNMLPVRHASLTRNNHTPLTRNTHTSNNSRNNHAPLARNNQSRPSRPDRDLEATPTSHLIGMREHRSASQSWARRDESSLPFHNRPRGQRSFSQTWSRPESSDRTLPTSWRSRNKSDSYFRPQLSPIAGTSAQEEQMEYENNTTLSSSLELSTDQGEYENPTTLSSSVHSYPEEGYSSSEYVNFSPSRSPISFAATSGEQAQPYLDCMPSDARLEDHTYDMEEEEEGEGEGLEEGVYDSFEDSSESEDSFETVSDNYEADTSCFTCDEKDSHPYDLESQHSETETDPHTYEKVH